MMILESFKARCKSLACSDVNFYLFEIRFTQSMVFNALRFSAILLMLTKYMKGNALLCICFYVLAKVSEVSLSW